MNVPLVVFSLRELTCMHCVSGAVNTQGFVWKVLYALYINFHSFIYSCRSYTWLCTSVSALGVKCFLGVDVED